MFRMAGIRHGKTEDNGRAKASSVMMLKLAELIRKSGEYEEATTLLPFCEAPNPPINDGLNNGQS